MPEWLRSDIIMKNEIRLDFCWPRLISDERIMILKDNFGEESWPTGPYIYILVGCNNTKVRAIV